MFKLNAAARLKASESDIAEHTEQDELDTEDFLSTNPTTAADTLDSRDPRDTSQGMSASQKLAARFRAKAAMGDNTISNDPLTMDMEDASVHDVTEAGSTVDDPFDNFDNAFIPEQGMTISDQPDIVRGAKKHPKKKPAHHKRKPKKSLVDKLLEDDTIMYQNEAAARLIARSTVDTDSEPGSIHVRFPVSKEPTDGSDYLNAGYDDHDLDTHEMLGEPSEEGEVHILGSEEPAEVLSDADAQHLWNVANQPLS